MRGRYGMNGECMLFPSKGKTTWEGFVPPCEFKDGDIVISAFGDIHLLSTEDSSYCSYRKRWRGLPKFDETITTDIKVDRLATEEEKQELFDAIKSNGYKWNEETKTLEKLVEPKFKVGDKITNGKVSITIGYIDNEYYYEIGRNISNRLFIKNQDEWNLVPNKFDITTLKPFDKVLVRTFYEEWKADFFSHYSKEADFPYSTVGKRDYYYCIPYEGNEHLCGTTNDCDEYYKNWE